MHGNSSCIGIQAKASSDNMVERSSNLASSKRILCGPSLQPQRKWWAASSGEMEQNTSMSPRDQDAQNCDDDSNGTVFVNHALLLWEEQRRQWVGNGRRRSSAEAHKPVLSAGTTYEGLLTTSRPFPRPVALKEMMQFLVRIWIQEGLYDSRH